MKNLSVRKKLGISFGLVILLMVAILAVMVVTSLQQNRQLNAIANITNMQSETNTMLGEVYEARIELRTVFTEVENEEEYRKAMALLASALNRVDAVDGYVAAMPADQAAAYLEENAALRHHFSRLTAALEKNTTSNTEVSVRIEKMSDAANRMGTVSSEMVALINQVMLDRMESESDLVRPRFENVVMPTVYLSESIDMMRIQSEAFLTNLDLSMIPVMFEMVDKIESDLASLQNVLTSEKGKSAAGEVAEAINVYRDSLEELVEYIEMSDASVIEARQELDELLAVLDTGNAAVNNDVNSSVAFLVSTSRNVSIIMLILMVVSMALAATLSRVISRAITRPLCMMQEAMRHAGAEGDLEFSEEFKRKITKEAEGKDEIGQSLNLFLGMLSHIRYVAGCLEQLQNKDLTLEIEVLGERDIMGRSLKNLVEGMNDIFADISRVASEVATASGEVATGAQSLAQGSTEQASTVEEISASISEIAEQSKSSSRQAAEAAQFGQTIRETATDGCDKMEGMITSVQEINDASQAIGNVIKVIDDIAFQTNILALNAAVEAARAGEHGKGFAVVADEVRNLAGKSAEAAKETAELISANIEKAGTGMEMARETAASLQEIAEGIGKTSESLSEIAQQSEASEQATGQVNLAVDQVAQVVQQNSATSEQSAAASEEMSSQAQYLQTLIGQFKLRGQNGMGYITLPRGKDPVDEVDADSAPPVIF